jgi:dTDP-4-dehydrorhamnose 3,5-epimerase-like enzyme
MLKCFSDLIGETIESYVDNIIVKSKKVDQLMVDLEKTFKKLRENGIKLNPKKCVFGVPRGMLHGFIVFVRGIEANLEKIMAIT